MKTITKLYHGTSEENARKILREGITPRIDPDNCMKVLRPTQWERYPSRSDCVYLTEAYAPYFAAAAAPEGTGRWAILEIDSTKLDPLGFLPDEDALEQGSRELSESDLLGSGLAGSEHDAYNLVHTWDMEVRTEFFKDNLPRYRHLATESLRLLGNIVYQNIVPTSAITRVSFFDPRGNPHVALQCLDPQISTVNYQLCGAKYRDLTEWFFGGHYDWAEHSILPVTGREENRRMYEALHPGRNLGDEFIAQMDALWAHPHSSLEIIDNSTWKEEQSA